MKAYQILFSFVALVKISNEQLIYSEEDVITMQMTFSQNLRFLLAEQTRHISKLCQILVVITVFVPSELLNINVYWKLLRQRGRYTCEMFH